MARGRPKKQPSIAELQHLLGEQRKRRSKLLQERKRLQGRLDQIDREISMLDGATGAGTTAGGGRGRNERALGDVMESVLKKSNKPMKVGDIVAAVEAAGYQSTSANFRGIVNQTLIKDDRFSSPSRGYYELA